MTGFVSFVGSGPGDPELLTLKAVDRLKDAKVVLFDDLSSGPILDYVSSQANLVGVGKRAGRQSPKQHHVSRLLVDYASQGVKVVRLKSGDPGIFGRLEEEITALQDANISFEIIPGVTAASAAAAAATIPLTRRLSARRLQFVTGHDITGLLPDDLNLKALADPFCTSVIYMPKRTFPNLARRLIENGLSKDTKALLAESISLPDQKLTHSTLEQLAEQLSNETGSAPGIILLGPLA
ncbi:uroporphyrinogen-III C-methyltransferase [Paracoccaceae bacterium]|nr:uroporphyrinogen-III C-methyltransferase [Paracoccaceae bacterium]